MSLWWPASVISSSRYLAIEANNETIWLYYIRILPHKGEVRTTGMHTCP